MTNKEAKEKLYMEWQKFLEDNIDYAGVSEAYKMAFKALEQEPCEDAISRQEVLYLVGDYDLSMGQVVKGIHALPSVTPQEPIHGKCNQCKHYEGVHNVQGHAPCSYHKIGGVMWNWYCSQFENEVKE